MNEPFLQAVPTAKGQALADEYGIKFFETVSMVNNLERNGGRFSCCKYNSVIHSPQSAKTNLNVEQVFFSIARDIKQRLADTDSKAEVSWIYFLIFAVSKFQILYAHSWRRCSRQHSRLINQKQELEVVKLPRNQLVVVHKNELKEMESWSWRALCNMFVYWWFFWNFNVWKIGLSIICC